MISDILTEPLNLSSARNGNSSNGESSTPSKNLHKPTNTLKQGLDAKNGMDTKSPTFTTAAHKSKDNELKTRFMDPSVAGSSPQAFTKTFPPFGARPFPLCNQLLMPPNCIFPGSNTFQDLSRLKAGPFGDTFPVNPSSSPEHKPLGCFCSVPFCGGSSKILITHY